jgi:RNA polymerase sigma-70 factor (ECF subfamily)
MHTSRNLTDETEMIDYLHRDPRQAVAVILDRYGDALFSVLLRMTGSRVVAEELLQDVCLKVWKNADSYDADKGRLFTWLHRIAKNAALDKVRTQKFQRQRETKDIDTTVSTGNDPSEEMKVSDPGLQAVILRLDKKYQEVIDLLYLQGYTQSEATEELGVPLGTIKSRARIALRELRKLLANEPLIWVAISVSIMLTFLL